MTLPKIGDMISPYKFGLLNAALRTHPPVTNHNATHDAKSGNAKWVGKTLHIAAEGLINYWYIPPIDDEVSYCVVHDKGGYGDAYVISDGFGGCEYHTLSNAKFGLTAFLHVYRGGGITTKYTLADGWIRTRILSSDGMTKANGSHKRDHMVVSHIDRTNNTVKSKFISTEFDAKLRVSTVWMEFSEI